MGPRRPSKWSDYRRWKLVHKNHLIAIRQLHRSIALKILYGTIYVWTDNDAQPLVIPGIVLATVQSHVVLLTHKMSTHSVSEATRSHRPIEVILNSPGRNADRNAFARLVSPGRGNNFLITFLAPPIQTVGRWGRLWDLFMYETVRSFIIVVSRFA